ncbi:reovirus sigma C capsid domain protein [Ceratobasidium sp. AG-Ba]|nr:reovirus sigma C capsid domain protein [Ceratobasidium sp. AG-Ba]QRW04829.1 reovirus sigma C capsid domain protein [Ceratobasidium sp. AG-Ba]
MSSSSHARPSSVLGHPASSSAYTPSSSSVGHGGYMRPAPGARAIYCPSGDSVNLAEAFADVNRALGSRAARQSMPRQSSSRTIPANAAKISPGPPRPRTLSKPQPRGESIARMDMPYFTEFRDREEVVNPRFSIVSEPAYTQPQLAPWGHLRVGDSSRRASMIEQRPKPRRPELRIVIPGAPAMKQVPRGQRDIPARGHKSAASKNHSDCVIM